VTQAASLTGTVLDGKYSVDKILGEGGMGAVYRARHLGTKRVVALKVIIPRMTRSAEFVERFRREAESAGGLRHPNVVDVTDFGFARVGDDQVAYLVMEYLDGCTLAEILYEEKRLPLDWSVDIVEQTCAAIEEAHRAGIIHRDIKPQNIWLEPNRRGGYTVKVLDFGLAKVRDTGPEAQQERFQTGELPQLQDGGVVRTIQMRAEAATNPDAPIKSTASLGSESAGAASAPSTMPQSSGKELTRVGTVLGTPYYMSPEQCRGQSLDARSDIYSLAVVAYEMLCGERPFPGVDPLDVMSKHLTAEPRPLSEVFPKIPRAVSDVIMAALQKDPEKRPESAELFATTLRATSEGAGALLRRAVVLCTENFPAFLRLFAIAYLPLIALRLVGEGVDLFEARVPPAAFVAWKLAFGAAASIVTFLAAAVTRGVSALLMTQLEIAPLRDVKVHLALGVLRRRLRSLVLGSAFYVLAVGLPLGIFVTSMRWFAGDARAGQAGQFNVGRELEAFVELAIGLVAGYVTVRNFIRFSLFPIALLIEGKGVRESLRRSALLVSRGRRYIGPVAAVEVLEYASEVVFVVAAAAVMLNDAARDVVVAVAATGLELLVAPVVAIAYAMIYLKVRQALGESTRAMLKEQLVEQEIPRSQWLQRMHKSWATRSGSSFGGRSGGHSGGHSGA
jgi:serine/threonine protein kinase